MLHEAADSAYGRAYRSRGVPVCDGTVVANGDMGVFKQDYFDFEMRLKIMPGKAGLAAKLVSVKIKS